MGETHEQVRPAHNLQIGRACLDHGGVVGVNAHQLGGEEHRGHKEQHPHSSGQLYPNSQNVLDGFHVLPAPILRRQHGGAGCKAAVEHIQDKVYLPRQGVGGHSGLADKAQHQGVGHAHRRVYQVLDGDRHNHREKRAVKLFISGFQTYHSSVKIPQNHLHVKRKIGKSQERRQSFPFCLWRSGVL